MHLWRLRVDACDVDDWNRLSDAERKRAERVVIPSKQTQQVAARSGLRRILSSYAGVDARDLEFAYGEHEKPRLVGALPWTPIFNLSHSGAWALVAVTGEGRVGVDVEHARPGRDFMGISERFFALEEREYLARVDPGLVDVAFYRAWTRKEAYLKAWGTGLSFASSRFAIEYGPDGPGRVLRTEMPDDRPEDWHFVDLEVDARYPAAACWDRVVTELETFELISSM